jgi:NAD-dependent deacetylase
MGRTQAVNQGPPAPAEALARARAAVQAAGRIVAVTGAGISAESGIPTFRGAGGLWRSFRPEDLATPEAFQRDPRTVWEWYAWRRGLIAACVPNPGHDALARLALRQGHTTIVTQNVDGLHTRAAEIQAGGGDPTPAIPVEVHGAIDRDLCSGCGVRSPGSHSIEVSSVETLPRCVVCDALLRPDVIWFGEALETRVLSQAFSMAGQADVCLVAGTSALVHPAASIPLATLEHGGMVVEVNMEDTPLTRHAAISLRGSAGALLPALLDADDLP